MRVNGISAAATLLACVTIAGCGSQDAKGGPTESPPSAPAASTSSAPALTGSAAGDCDAGAISRALGADHTVVRCYRDWARVDAGGLGDAQAIARLVNGEWTRYTAFPTSICQSQARSDGVPEPELTSFRSC